MGNDTFKNNVKNRMGANIMYDYGEQRDDRKNLPVIKSAEGFYYYFKYFLLLNEYDSCI